jgi:hypothetical protein
VICGRQGGAGGRIFIFLASTANHHSTGAVAYRHQFHNDFLTEDAP